MLNLTEENSLSLQEGLTSEARCCHMNIHAKILTMFAANWTTYVEYLNGELNKVVSSARFTFSGASLINPE